MNSEQSLPKAGRIFKRFYNTNLENFPRLPQL